MRGGRVSLMEGHRRENTPLSPLIINASQSSPPLLFRTIKLSPLNPERRPRVTQRIHMLVGGGFFIGVDGSLI